MSPLIITKPTKLISTLTTMRDRAAQMEAEAHEERLAAERALRLARGTGDVQAQARQARSSPHHVGDESTTEQLMAAIAALIAEEPRTFQELIELTGARGNRISGTLVKLQREKAGVVNVGTAKRALWSIPRAPRYRATSVRKTETSPKPTVSSTRSWPRMTMSTEMPSGKRSRNSR